MNIKKHTLLIVVASFLGIVATIYLAYLHYFNLDPFCDISKVLSCTSVDLSKYSTIFNVPLSVLGLFYFVSILVLGIKAHNNKNILKYIGYLSIPVLIYLLYLTYIEIVVINSICIVCEFTKILTALIILGSLYFVNKE